MSGLFGTLSIALSGLSVSQDEMATTSNNVANANTPGYSREVTDIAAGDPIEEGAIGYGTGVVLQKIESLRDPILQIQIHQATGQNSSLNAALTELQQIQSQFASSNSGIGADISNFFNSLQQLSPDPTSVTLRQGVLTAAGTLAADFNAAAQSLQTQRSDIDQNVVQSVSQVNSLTSQIASVDQQIATLQNAKQGTGTLVDTQNSLIQQLSGLIGVAVIKTDQGISLATANGTALVSGSQSFALTTQLGTDGVQHILSGAQDLTTSLSGGSLGGLIQIRDQEIPSISSSLDQLAAGLATNLNAANAMGTDLNGARRRQHLRDSSRGRGGRGGHDDRHHDRPVADCRQFRRYGREQRESGQSIRRCHSSRWPMGKRRSMPMPIWYLKSEAIRPTLRPMPTPPA